MTITFGPLDTIDGTSEGRARQSMRARGYDNLQTSGASVGAGRMAMRVDGQDEGGGTLIVIVPDIGYAETVMRAGGQDASHNGDAGLASQPMRAAGFDSPPGMSVGRVAISMHAQGFEFAPLQAYGFLVERPGLVVGYAGIEYSLLADGLRLGQILSPTAVPILRALLALTGAPATRYEGTVRTTDALAFGDKLAFVLYVALQEGFALHDAASADHRALARVIARLLLSGYATTYAEAFTAVLDGMAFVGTTEALHAGVAVDQARLSDLAANHTTAFAALLDRLLLQDTARGTHTAYVLLDDRMRFDASLTSTADLVALLRDSVGFAFSLSIDNGEYIAWTLNTVSKGLTRYTDYPYNSFAKLGGIYYGARSDGLYRLDGVDDNGAAIRWRMRLGLDDFGTRRFKRIEEAYLGYSGDGRLLLRAISVNAVTGEKEAALYKLTPRGAASIRENRFTLGRGAKSVDWDFELEGLDGARLDLSAFDFLPLAVDRRTRN